MSITRGTLHFRFRLVFLEASIILLNVHEWKGEMRNISITFPLPSQDFIISSMG